MSEEDWIELGQRAAAVVAALEAADRVDAHNEPEHQAAEDLEYFRDNLFRSLKIPLQYLVAAPEEAADD